MSEFDRLPRHPWLDKLLANPQLAVADLLSGRANKSPYARLRNAEFLYQILQNREGLDAEYDALETALIGWLDARRNENWAARTRRGMAAYIGALIEALSAIQMLSLKRVAYQLSEQHNTYLRWLEPLRLGTASDPALELWRCHALLPQDSHYLPYWMRFCVEAGDARPVTYLTVALQGLRELPTGQANDNLRYALRGLAQRYLARQNTSEAKNEFKQYHATLHYSYPRAPETWRTVWDAALEGIARADTIRALLDGKTDTKPRKPDTKKTAAPCLDPSRFHAESQALANELKSGKAVTALWPRIEKLFNETVAYCRHSGDSYHFVRSLCRVGDTALKRTRTPEATARALLAWLPEALEWERDNPHVWMLWAHCLDKIGVWDHCEWVYWEMRRYFPDDEHCRTELARLLMRQGREAEAVGLLREAAERFPDHEPSRIELARLLMRQGTQHYPEAEKWLREVAERDPDDEPSRVILAHLMMAKGEEHYPAAEKWLREITERHPDNAHSRVILARLLNLRGDKSAAIDLLAELSAENSTDKFAETGFQSQHSDKDMPQICGEKNKVSSIPILSYSAAVSPIASPDAPIQATAHRVHYETCDVTQPLYRVTTPARPDALTQAAAQAARAAFRLNLQDAGGRAELETLLDADPDDQLAAFYLAWVDSLPQGYAIPPEAYALTMAGAWRAPAAADWEELVQRFPLQRHLTWALRWLACLRDGAPLLDGDWQPLDKFAQADAPHPAPGEAIVARLVREWGRVGIGQPAAALDARAQELIALNINRNLDPIAFATH
ncbi:MAG: tetratricopeptide repeat protein [Sulfuricellaceae bacterium]